MDDITTVLGIADTGRVAEFLLHKMPMETRHALMAELPVAYAKLYPNVSPELLSNHVAARIRQDRNETHYLAGDRVRVADVPSAYSVGGLIGTVTARAGFGSGDSATVIVELDDYPDRELAFRVSQLQPGE